MTVLTDAWEIDAGTTWTVRDSEVAECLIGVPVPALTFQCSAGGEIDLAALTVGATVVYVHPGTDTQRELREDPDGLLGTGCTVQSCVYDDYLPDFEARGVRIVGLSSQRCIEQQALVTREHLGFALLSDPSFELAEALDLPTIITPSGDRVYKRLTFLAREGVVEKVFYPVPIPRRDAIDVLSWMGEQGPIF